MNSYTIQKDEQHKVPEDARNLRIERDIDGERVITFQSDTGPVKENNGCGCQQCDTDEDATPNNLTPRRKTPWGDN